MSSRRSNNILLLFSGLSILFIGWISTARPSTRRSLNRYDFNPVLADTIDTDTIPDENVKYKPSKKPTYKSRDRYGDEFSNSPGKQSPLILGRPKNVKTEVKIDTSGEYYTVDEKLNGVDYRPPTTMTYDQYKKYQNKQAVKNYYRSKSKAADEKEAAKNDKPRALVPRIYMSPNLDRVFGGNYIDVKLNGSVLLDFGYRIQTTNNPNIPVAQRTIGGFFFDQNIALNAQGKIGERLRITVNQDTRSQFDFDNNFKVEYSSLETDIIQKVEAGNVSMPINSTLIRGAQNLFGVKALLKFGRLSITAVAANQRGRGQEVRLSGGGQGREFQVRADNYEDNRHYLLAHFFRRKYEPALRTLPQITSGVNVTRVEVWITNRNNTTDVLKSIAALMDLGEHNPYNSAAIQKGLDTTASNNANSLGRIINNKGAIRLADNTSSILSAEYNLANGNDFEIIRNARRLRETEFKFHPQLGYISLNTAVGRDDVVGVAYEYYYKGERYQVGEFSNDPGLGGDRNVLFVKLLRPSTIRTRVPMWDLQMKNIYSLQANNIQRENFQLRIAYRDDRTQLMNPVITEPTASRQFELDFNGESNGAISGQPLVMVMGLDRLNMSNDPQPDGNFDFVASPLSSPVQPQQNPAVTQQTQNNNNLATGTDPTIPNANSNSVLQTNRIEAITIDPQAGRLIFPVLEPFGSHLKNQIGSDTITRPEFVQKYVYQELYRNTKSDALQLANKNKFYIVGRYQATSSDEIPIQGFGGTVDPRFVRVTANNIPLTDNVDYVVNQNTGSVRIINPAYLLPGQEVRVTYEQGDLFQVRTKTFYGARLDYILNKDIAFGGTVLALRERPLISRVPLGDEPVNNTIWGLDATFKRDSRILTRMIDALPIVSTKEKSTIQASGEFAQLVSSAPPLANKNNGTFFLDDFENTSVPFRLDNAPVLNWRLAATPPGFEGPGYSGTNILAFSNRRAKLAWYVVDPVFYRGSPPGSISERDLQNHYSRPVTTANLFPGYNNTPVQLNEPIFDLAYFPEERGPFNFSTNLTQNGLLTNPANNWAGITRAVNNYDTDFDNANYQYMEFWLMDPFIQGDLGKVLDGRLNQNNTTGGKLEFHLGSVSEDVLKDGKQSFEQGLPINGNKENSTLVDRSPWGWVTNQPFITDAFSNEGGSRQNQDIGLDGLNNEEERQFYSQFVNAIQSSPLNPEAKAAILADPSADDFKYFLGQELDSRNAKIVERFKSFNGMEGNSPDNSNNTSGFNASSYTVPDNEDINKNNTLNDLEAFFRYKIDLTPESMKPGQNFIINEVVEAEANVKWYLFRIPLREKFEKVGNIEDFKSVRYLRTVLTGWTQPVVLRMAKFQMVASQWRPFIGDLSSPGLKEIIEPDDKVFTISTVNIEENSKSVNTYGSTKGSYYTVPPGFTRDRDVNSTVPRQLNEHSMRLCVEDLQDNDARAAFKNVGGLNLLNFENVRMFVHAEGDTNLFKTGDLTVFMRLGADFTDNYYEIEVPLVLSAPLAQNDREVWKVPFDVNLRELVELKLRRDRELNGDLFSVFPAYVKPTSQTMYIRGNPQYTNIQTLMIGIRNPKSPDRLPKSVCIWVNELRVTDIRTEDGWAATGRVNVKLADIGNVSGNFKYTTAGFGGLEQKVSQRLLENSLEYGVNANIAVDKFIPANEKIGIRLPMYVSYDKKTISPQFDPMNPDVPLEKSIANKPVESRQSYADKVEDNTVRRSIAFNNIQKVKVKPNAKKYIYDIENISINLSYSDTRRQNINIAEYDSKNYKAGIGYNYSPRAPTIEPLKKAGGIFKSPYLRLIKDFNFIPFPNNLSVRGDLDRTISKTLYSNGFLPNGDRDVVGMFPNYEKRFLFNRNYALGWSITKSLTFNYTAQTFAIIDEPYGGFTGFPNLPSGRSRTDSVIYNLKNGGRIKTFNQQVSLNYKLPLDKFPATNWLNADARYAAAYTFIAGPVRNLKTDEERFQLNLGNTAQNTRDITLNGRADFLKLYNKIKFLSTVNSPTAAPKPPPPAPNDTSKNKPKPPPQLKGLKASLRFLMMVRSGNITFQRTEGTVLPGYMGSVKYFGLDNSGGSLYEGFLPFVLGSQDPGVYKNDDFARRYMSPSDLQTNFITRNLTQNISGRLNVEPFKDFRIQLDAKVSHSLSYQEFFKVYTDSVTRQYAGFNTLNPMRTGNYSISFIAIQTFFEEGGGVERFSPTFQTYEKNRYELINRLSEENPNKENGYLYDTSSQDVLIPSFIAAYTKTNPKKVNLNAFPAIPLPNWRIDYAGLPNVFPSLKKLFPSISINHSYSATYSVNSFTSSGRYGKFSNDTLAIDNFNRYYYPSRSPNDSLYEEINKITQVSIIERFAPLLGINVKTKSNMTFRVEYRTDRSLYLQIPNRQITESRNSDITIGYGYTKPNMKLPIKYQGREVVLKNDITFRVDVTRRETTTIQRIPERNSIFTQGNVTFQIRPNISYQLNQRLTSTLYFEYNLQRPKVNVGGTRTVFAFGIQLRYSLS